MARLFRRRLLGRPLRPRFGGRSLHFHHTRRGQFLASRRRHVQPQQMPPWTQRHRSRVAAGQEPIAIGGPEGIERIGDLSAMAPDNSTGEPASSTAPLKVLCCFILGLLSCSHPFNGRGRTCRIDCREAFSFRIPLRRGPKTPTGQKDPERSKCGEVIRCG